MFLAGILIGQDRMEEGVRFLSQAVADQPILPGGQRQLGMALDRLGDREGALAAFQKAVACAPKDATARLLLGRLLLDQGEVEKAVGYLQSACELNPKSAGAFYLLGQARNQMGDPEAGRVALETFQRLKQVEKAELDARNDAYDDGKFVRAVAVGLHMEAARYFVRLRRPSLAEAHLRQAVLLEPLELSGQEMLASLLLQAGRLSDARAVFQELVRFHPERALYRANLGTVLLQLKDSCGEEELKRALELDPRQPQALHNLARLYLSAQRELSSALALCYRLIEAEPTAANYDLLGWAHFANGQRTEASAAAAKAVALDPTNQVYREHQRKVLEKVQ